MEAGMKNLSCRSVAGDDGRLPVVFSDARQWPWTSPSRDIEPIARGSCTADDIHGWRTAVDDRVQVVLLTTPDRARTDLSVVEPRGSTDLVARRRPFVRYNIT